MSPFVAFLLCVGFIAWLFREDMKWRRLESSALWIAGIWVTIVGSRSPTYWTAYLGLGGGVESNLEGSPLNFLITTVLIVAAVLVLQRQGINWGAIFQNNKGFFLIYFFFAASALWSEYPFVGLRRLFKDFGAVPVALLLLTQSDPAAAIRAIYVRVSFILFPLSVLFYKWFPELGRTYSKGGEPLFAGVATFKNELGQTLMVFAIVLLWDFFELRKEKISAVKKRQVIIHCACLVMTAWLLLVSQSATPLVCLILGLLIWWKAGWFARLRRPFQVLLSVLAIALCVGVVNAVFHPSQMILEALGRDPSLTGRTDAWPVMMETVRNPAVGTGYRMFWDVYRQEVEDKAGVALPSAHNGYVETYLAGGVIGLILLGIFVLGTGLTVAEGLLKRGNFGRLGFVFWIVLLVYNWTESCFFWGGSLWFAFLLWGIKSSTMALPAVDVPRRITQRLPRTYSSRASSVG